MRAKRGWSIASTAAASCWRGDVAKHHPAANPGMEDLIREAATADATLLRILRNLDDAYERLGQMPERQFMRRLAVKLMED